MRESDWDPLIIREQRDELLAALKSLRSDAEMLCNRDRGSTYEANCRRSITAAVAAIAKAEGK